ncbi:MAG TPA: hypothetical protein VFX45_02170 [Solirubrobacterales bacterium]|nr:hypothetical protein [Solirubrobacterales bacterium]
MRQVTPHYYECLELVVVGGVPPNVTGLPHPIPDQRLCGTRFQIGGSGPALSCAFCGLDSIGTCEGGCGRRLCGNHGTTNAPFLCRECIAGIEAERKQAEDERVAQGKRELAEIAAQLRNATAPSHIADLIRRGGPGLPSEAIADAWSRLMEAGALRPAQWEIVTVTFSYRRPFGNAAKETARRPGWIYHPRLKRQKDSFLIDQTGILWDDPGEAPGSSKRIVLSPWSGGKVVGHLAVIAGDLVDARSRRSDGPGWYLRSGVWLRSVEASSSERLAEAVPGAIECWTADSSAGANH